MINNKKLLFVMGLFIVGMLAGLAVSLTLAESSTTVVDDSANTGRYTSIAIYNGRPIISYYDIENLDLWIAMCQDATCQEHSLLPVDSQGDVGQYTSLALTDGQPIISYYDMSQGALRLSTCLNQQCQQMTQVTVDDAEDVGQYNSLVLNDELPVISYYDATNGDLKLAICNKLRCNNPDITIVDQADDVGRFSSLRFNNDLPVISYYDATNGDLKLAVCNNTQCSNPAITVVDQSGDVGQFSALALHNGNPVIGYYDATNSDLKLAICHDPFCTNVTRTALDTEGDVGRYLALELYYGKPVISYYDATHQALKLAICNDADCTTTAISVMDSVDNVGLDTDLVLNNHEIFISYHDATHQSLKLAADVLAIGCYLNAPSNVNEGDHFTVQIACNQVPQPVFGFQIGHQIMVGEDLVQAEAQQFTPGDAFEGQFTLPGPNTLDVYALSLTADGHEVQGRFTLGSVSYAANEPGEISFDLVNPIFGAINGDEINGILATQTGAAVTINDVFHAKVMGSIHPENGLELIHLSLEGEPLVEKVLFTVNPETGSVDFTYDNIQNPTASLRAAAESHLDCVQSFELQDNAIVDLGDQLLLLAGDVTDDNAIDIQDTSVVSTLLGQVPQDDEDINHDGMVNILDLIFVSRNYDTIGPTTCAQ